MTTEPCILIVEDNELDQYVARHYLKKAWPDADFIVVNNGHEAIDHLKSHPDSLPDIVFLDINMPRMDGHEFLEAWYSDAGRKAPVVVMLTSADQHQDREKAALFDAVVGYIVKPLGKSSLPWLMEVVEGSDDSDGTDASARGPQAAQG